MTFKSRWEQSSSGAMNGTGYFEIGGTQLAVRFFSFSEYWALHQAIDAELAEAHKRGWQQAFAKIAELGRQV
jgi:hypothetical protein